MTFPKVAVTGLGLWFVGYPSARAWSLRIADDSAQKPLGSSLDRANRRRAGTLSRALADVTAEAMRQAGVDIATVPTVIGSALGEARTMIDLLDSVWRHDLPMSPADFAVSVHNTASGLISISNKNRGMTTSIAADEDTPVAALLEATGLVLTRGTPVVVACADEPAPAALVQHAPPWAMLAAAVVLEPFESGRPCLATLRVVTDARPTIACDDFGALLVANPQIGLAWLVDAVQRRTAGIVALDRGTGRGFAAEIAPGPLA